MPSFLRHEFVWIGSSVAFWAQRGRALTSELVGGNREKLSGGECATIATRAIGLLPDRHGAVTMRIDSAYYAVELLQRLRREQARFTVSAPRNQAMCLTARRRTTIHPEQLALALDGQLAWVFGYSFILADIPHQPTVWVEHFHRHRAQIEERLKDTKLGQALRHLPSGNLNANRVWLTAALLALNLTASCCDLCPAARLDAVYALPPP